MPDTNNSLTAYPFPGMLAYSIPGLLNPDFVKADGRTEVNPNDYPQVTQILDITTPNKDAIAYSPLSKKYVTIDSAGGISTGFWHSDNGIIWTRGTKFVDLGLNYHSITQVNQIIFADNKFISLVVIDATSTGIFASIDGINWVQVAHLTTDNPFLNCVTFGAGRFIAAGLLASGAGVSYHSTDNGNTWTIGGFTTASTTAQSIAYSETLSLFVIAANTGKFYTSADDGSWIEKAGTDTNLNWIIWDTTNAKFVASGINSAAGAIVTSADGITFTPATYTGATAIHELIYSNIDNIYVAADDDTGYIFTSPDLATWTQRSNDNNFYNHLIFTGDNSLVAYIAVGTGSDNGIGLSSDAIAWNNPPPGFGISYYVMPNISNQYIKLR